MASYQDIRSAVLDQWSSPSGAEVRYLIKGPPGGGKSDLSRDILKSTGVAEEDTIELTLSLYDTPDLLGLPDLDGDYSRWKAPAHLALLAKKSFSKKVGIILEEYTDATVPVFNVSCQLLLNNRLGELRFGQGLHIVANGNRTKDKSGANRLPTKAANRLRIKEYESNLDDWILWALKNGIHSDIIQCLRWRPALFHDFDPNRETNPTPRSWARVNLINHNLPDGILFDEIKGDVGEGAAAEYMGFRRISPSLEIINMVFTDPEKAIVPTDPAILYALTGAIAHRVDKTNWGNVYKFLVRLEPEFQVMLLKDAVQMKPEIKMSKEFGQWCLKHGSVLL